MRCRGCGSVTKGMDPDRFQQRDIKRRLTRVEDRVERLAVSVSEMKAAFRELIHWKGVMQEVYKGRQP